MTISTITKTMNRNAANAAYADVLPDLIRTLPVRVGKLQHLIPENPLSAGIQFHALLQRMADSEALSPREKALLPWLTALRTEIGALGVWQTEIEANLESKGIVPNGTCDLLVQGGPAPSGVIEVKVISRGTQPAPRGRDLAQLTSYAMLNTERQRYDDVWAAMAYVELETGLVRLFIYNSVSPLVEHTLRLLRAA